MGDEEEGEGGDKEREGKGRQDRAVELLPKFAEGSGLQNPTVHL